MADAGAGGRHPVRALWSVPRTASTAFERMVIERGDHAVFDEPFSRHYYFGPEKVSGRYEEVLPRSRPEEILAELDEAAAERPVFLKDMAYHAVDALPAGVLAGFANSFLVRHPAAMLPSLAQVWPDPADDEVGYDALARMVGALEAAGGAVVVIDSDDLLRDPPGVVAAWCGRMGIPFDAGALTWAPGMRPEWELWQEWHRRTATTRGFAPPSPTPDPPAAGTRLRDLHDRCLPVYRRLWDRRLRPEPVGKG
jgi:hypothetical protein